MLGPQVCLQEYDIHNAAADYRGEGSEPFHAAMNAAGYGFVFCKDRGKDAGVATYFRSDVFELDGPPGDQSIGSLLHSQFSLSSETLETV